MKIILRSVKLKKRKNKIIFMIFALLILMFFAPIIYVFIMRMIIALTLYL